MIIAFRGKPGVGKSTIAQALAKSLQAPIIGKDDINDIVFAQYGANKQASELSYELIFYMLRVLKPLHQTIVVDCSLAVRAGYDRFASIADELHTELVVVTVEVEDVDEIERRLNLRSDLPDHRVKTMGDIQKQGLSYEDYDVAHDVRVVGTQPLDALVAAIQHQLPRD